MTVNTFVYSIVTVVSFNVFLIISLSHAQPLNINEQYMFADEGKTESVSKELYDDFRQVIRQKLIDNDATTASKSTSMEPSIPIVPPKPNEIPDWPKNDLKLGQVTAVAINPDGHPVLFHRHDRVWNEE